MFQTIMVYSLSSFLLIGFLGGCANVEVWDRNILAKDHMTVIPDPLGAQFVDHMHISREGTEGATGISSGGCGCN